MKFTWDPDKAALNLERHQVSFEEAIESFFDPNALDDTEAAPDTIRIISARKAERKYKNIYEQPKFS